MGLAVFPRGNTVNIFKGPGEMELVVIAYLIADFSYRQVCFLQQLGSPGHPVVQQEGLGAFSHGFPKDLAKITSVQAAESGDFFNGDIPMVVFFDKGEGFLDVKIPQPPDVAVLSVCGGFRQLGKEQKTMANQMHRVGAAVVDDIHHLILKLLTGISVSSGVDRLTAADSG